MSLQPYTGPTDAASIQKLIIDERRRVLFAEGFELRHQRLNVPFNPPADGVPDKGGGSYGDTRFCRYGCQLLNNPSIT